MARQSIKVTLGHRDSDTPGSYSSSAGMSGTGADATTLVADQVTAAAALATLVADGATPTQAHVTAFGLTYTALAADIAALNTALSGDVQITWDSTKVTTITQLKAVFAAALQAAAGGGILTA